MARNTPDIVKLPLRLLIEDRSANKTQHSIAEDNLKQEEKTGEVKKVTNTELEQPPRLKAYIKYPKYDFF